MNNTIAVWRLPYGSRAIEPVDLHPEPLSLDQGTQQLPGGGYTTFRTFDKFGILRLQDHYLRLEETAQLAGKPVNIDREILQQLLRKILGEYPSDEMRVRIILDLEQRQGDVFLLVDALHAPGALDYQQGVKAVTRQMQRNNAKAKLTRFISTASIIREQMPSGVNETIMISEDGCLLEGLSSNFFAILDGVIWTAEKDVLSGITRSMVLDAIQDEKIPLKLQGLPVDDLRSIDEAFITSASRAVLPVTSIDGAPVGDGSPGPITLRLLAAYRQRLEKDLDYV